MDSMSAALLSGQRFRTLALIDDYTCKAPPIEAGTFLPGSGWCECSSVSLIGVAIRNGSGSMTDPSASLLP